MLFESYVCFHIFIKVLLTEWPPVGEHAFPPTGFAVARLGRSL